MTRPHEETWQLDADNDVRRVNKSGERTSLVCLRAAAGTVEGQVLIAAAPDLARELRHLVRLLEPKEREGGLDVPGLATLNGARAALKKAGVP